MKNQIPEPIKQVLDQAGRRYADSPATTNAGRVLRFIVRLIPLSAIAKMLAAKVAK